MSNRASMIGKYSGLLVVCLLTVAYAFGPLGKPIAQPVSVAAVIDPIPLVDEAIEGDSLSNADPSPEAAALLSGKAELPDAASIDGVPLIEQLPELERGCEVTSLAMLLQFYGVDVDKLTLADQVKKDPTPFEQLEDGTIRYGNPNDGFVGDIASTDEPGYGVYHGPVLELAQQYVGKRALDLTGSDFDQLLAYVSIGQPVWVIANVLGEPLTDDSFETWETPDGPIRITYLEHSVVMTGFTEDKVRLNDPLEGEVEVDRAAFSAAWEQMGRQAIVVLPEPPSQT